MALTGNDISARYKDVVQLEQGGDGLPSHAGKEAALYDGSGAQILGRTAVRHWLDPDPDAIAGSWEFSTYGDATQGELETAGWTFSDCTAAVTQGVLMLTSTGSNNMRAYLTVSLAGDFDYVTRIFTAPTSPAAQYDYVSGLLIGIPGPTDLGFITTQTFAGNELIASYYNPDTFDDSGFGGGGTSTNVDLLRGLIRVARYSGTVYTVAANDMFYSFGLGASAYTGGSWNGGSSADSSTMTRVALVFDATTAGQKFMIPFLRRYA